MGPPPVLPGFEPQGGLSFGTDYQSKQARMLATWQALKLRIGLGLGPTTPRWSTYPGDDLTPENIVRYRREAQSGYPWRWAELCEQVFERNSHLQSLFHFRRAWSHLVPGTVTPQEHMQGDEGAEKIAAWAQASLAALRPVWPRVIHNLLSAPGYGFSGAENFWDSRDVTFRREGKAVTVPGSFIPVWMESLHQKSFVFQLVSDKPLLYCGDGIPGAPWKLGKITFCESLGDGVIGRRGFMTAAVWMEFALQSAWRDLILFMHLYGLPQFALLVEKEILDQSEERQYIDEGLEQYGQGKIPLWLKEATVEPLGQVQGAPLHPSVINLIKDDLSVLVTGSILAQTQGNGTGSYNAGENHAITAHMYRMPDGEALARAIEQCLLWPAVEFNVGRLAEAFKLTPEQVRQRLPIFSWKMISPSPTVPELLDNYSKLASMGFPASMAEISVRSGHKIGEGTDVLPGPLQTVASGGKAVGVVDAAQDHKLGENPAPEKPAPAAAGKKPLPQKFTRNPSDPDRSVCVMLVLPKGLAEQLALLGGEPAEELHVTLAYLGRESELAALGVPVERVALALEYGLRGAPEGMQRAYPTIPRGALAGAIGGVLRFPASATSEGLDPYCAGVDVPGLVELRQAVVAAVEATGAKVRRDHGFTPHVTRAFLDPAAPSPEQTLAARPVRFTQLHLIVGGERIAFPLEDA